MAGLPDQHGEASHRHRDTAFVSGTVGVIAAVSPHVLHHLGPLAGAALLTGALGNVLFGIIGFVFMVPMLVHLRRRFNSILAPVAASGLFVLFFGLSTLWLRDIPNVLGDHSSSDHAGHELHQNHEDHSR
jgi:hypothetical protein